MEVIKHEELLRGVDECVTAARLLNAKLNLMHFRDDKGSNVPEIVVTSAVKHLVSDLYSALDRMVVAVYAAARHGEEAGLPLDVDISNVNMWHSWSIFEPLPPSPAPGAPGVPLGSGTIEQIKRENKSKLKRFVDNVIGEGHPNAELRKAFEILLEMQPRTYKSNDRTPAGPQPLFDPLLQEDSLRRQFSRLYFLRNFTAHRCRVTATTGKGFMWFFPDRRHEVHDRESTDQGVTSVELPYAGMWITMPDDPRSLGGAWRAEPLLTMMSSLLRFVEDLRKNFFGMCLRALGEPELKSLPEVAIFGGAVCTLDGKRIVVSTDGL